jgi:predicted AAA+ superfamily ATPase
MHSVVREKELWKIRKSERKTAGSNFLKRRELIDLPPVTKELQNFFKLRKEINLFVLDLRFEGEIDIFKKMAALIIHMILIKHYTLH